MRALGFTVSSFRLNMALPPELLLTLVASVNTIDVGRIKELIQKNAEKKLLVTISSGRSKPHITSRNSWVMPLSQQSTWISHSAFHRKSQ